MLEPINKIEITPMVGVALILVIIFVVTSPLIISPADMDLQLPKAAATQSKSAPKVMITYSQDGRLAVNEEEIPRGLLKTKLKEELRTDKNKLIIIRADKHVKHRDILALLSAVKHSGARNIAIATEQRSRLNM